MGKSKIKWCTKTWNPMVGCSDELPCFARCWARGLAKRFAANPQFSAECRERYRQAFTAGPQLFPDRLDEPLHWRKPQTVFVCSQGDLFHKDVPFEFIDKIGDAMRRAPWHTYLPLTKRPARMREYLIEYRPWEKRPELPPPNVWLGVSVEDQTTADERIPALLQIPAAKHWLSIEPMLGPVNIDDYLDCGHETGGPQGWQPKPSLDWVVVGGESGPRARPMHPDWPRKVRDDCKAAGVKFMFKQWGEYSPSGPTNPPGFNAVLGILTDKWIEQDGYAFLRVGKKNAGRVLDGVLHDDGPGAVK